MHLKRLITTGTIAGLLLVALVGVVSAQPAVHVEWRGSGGGALNIHVDGLPANAGVSVVVTDISHGNQVERPVGTPPATADEKGRWPGPKAGSRTGYPGTASDPGCTNYVITVRVNGKTGPSVKVKKPSTRRSFWSILATLGGVLLTDAVGVTGRLEALPNEPIQPIAATRPRPAFI